MKEDTQVPSFTFPDPDGRLRKALSNFITDDPVIIETATGIIGRPTIEQRDVIAKLKEHGIMPFRATDQHGREYNIYTIDSEGCSWGHKPLVPEQ